ncbi:metallophosphoesterase [Candidatus Sumerlaeota bacterium]|nr:metallophosphoesterase [Candidatus Sumerlaeota bacterium]
MRIIHFSDLHVWRMRLDWDLYPRRFLGLANLALNRARVFPHRVAERLARQLTEEEADAVIFSGDLTTTSYSGEFDLGRKLMTPLMEKYGDRFLTIPGNHDRYTPRVTRERWMEQRFLHGEQKRVALRSLSEKLSALLIDASFPQLIWARGKIDAETLDAISALLENEKQNKRDVIVVCHYPIAYPQRLGGLHRALDGHGLIGEAMLRERIDQPPVVAYLHGHEHRRWAVRLNRIVSLNAGSAGKLSSRPADGPGYISFNIQNGVVENVEAVYLRAPDFEEWTRRNLEIEPL